ncbi:MAG: YfiR family protein [Acidobacteriota bacterium]
MVSAISNADPCFARRGLIYAWARWMVAAWLCLLTGSACAQAAKPSEYDVKAAYLLNFGKFMRFAGSGQAAGGAFNICILGRDPLGRSMDQIAANETVDGRAVHVQRLGDATQGRSCQVVYISPFEAPRLREDLAILEGSNALTVGDTPDFLERGGMIQFVLQADHVRFSVNLNAVDRTHIVLSSELLRVAVSVEGKPNRGGAR